MRRTFENFTIKLGLINLWPLVTHRSETGKAEGLLYDLWVYVAQSLGLRWTEFDIDTDFGTAYYETLDYLQNRTPNADVIVMPSIVILSKFKVSFSVAFDYTHTVLISNLRGQCEVTAYDQFPRIEIPIRLATLVSILATSLVIYVNERKYGLMTYLFETSIILIHESVLINPTKTAARIVWASFLLGLFPLITTFLNEMNANVVTCSEKIPDSFEDLLKMNRPAVISIHSNDYPHMMSSSDANVRLLMSKIKESKGVFEKSYHFDASETERALLKEKRTIIASDLPFVRNLIFECEKGGEDAETLRRLTLRFGATRYFMKALCMPIRKELPAQLVDLINTRILYYKNIGLYEYENRKLTRRLHPCLGPMTFLSYDTESDATTLNSINLLDTASFFKLWAVALTLSASVLVIETVIPSIRIKAQSN